MQNRHPGLLPFALEGPHETVSVASVAATVGVNLDSSPAGVGLPMDALLPAWRAPGRAAAGNGGRRFPALAGADCVRSDWDRGCQSTRYGLGWVRVGESAASSLSRFLFRTTRSFFPTSVQAGVQSSAPCGLPVLRLTGLTGTRCAFFNSFANLASPVLSSCSSRDQMTWGGSRSAFWPMVAQSNMRLKSWKSRWTRKPRLGFLRTSRCQLSFRQVYGWGLAA